MQFPSLEVLPLKSTIVRRNLLIWSSNNFSIINGYSLFCGDIKMQLLSFPTQQNCYLMEQNALKYAKCG